MVDYQKGNRLPAYLDLFAEEMPKFVVHAGFSFLNEVMPEHFACIVFKYFCLMVKRKK